MRGGIIFKAPYKTYLRPCILFSPLFYFGYSGIEVKITIIYTMEKGQIERPRLEAIKQAIGAPLEAD